MHDLPLVYDAVLHGQCRGNHLTGRTEVIELAAVQCHYGYRKRT